MNFYMRTALAAAAGGIPTLLLFLLTWMWREARLDPCLGTGLFKRLRYIQDLSSFESIAGKRLGRIIERVQVTYTPEKVVSSSVVGVIFKVDQPSATEKVFDMGFVTKDGGQSDTVKSGECVSVLVRYGTYPLYVAVDNVKVSNDAIAVTAIPPGKVSRLSQLRDRFASMTGKVDETPQWRDQLVTLKIAADETGRTRVSHI